MNFGVLSRDGDVVVPPFDDALAGVTVSRLMELVERVRGRERERNGGGAATRPHPHAL